MNVTLTVLTLAASLLVLLTVWAYDRALAEVRAERDELLDILDDNVDDMRRMAAERHPSAQYGRGNLRVVR